MVALRIELSATRLSAGYGRPALDYQRACRFREALRLVAIFDYEQSRVCRNRTALDRPKRSVQTTTLHARYFGPAYADRAQPECCVRDSCGIRTLPAWLERPVTSPEVERAVLGSSVCQRGPPTQSKIMDFAHRSPTPFKCTCWCGSLVLGLGMRHEKTRCCSRRHRVSVSESEDFNQPSVTYVYVAQSQNCTGCRARDSTRYCNCNFDNVRSSLTAVNWPEEKSLFLFR